ncbi:NADPH-dependent 2,4-dienoyl-CoA reductase, sulfur reductase [Shimia gijangensis]|uniref:NADPH-dependent 2,4-dienoyl-CoA reductase, sulfur reductase n=1 Tax=Shimia gijangensis TaxID=1470563 RepID=A0A1M6RYR1_9RHOB|nr:NAD(P)/FAD-dependent oxidoreductase [Shimia gijangensis]SHK37634.1 NADPH-dependent 2,4-dienoyl-CoA reductase, sulfur reductase [Shimia gijangensis]
MKNLIVIGAGPAGMSAAATAARGGAKVLLLDEQPHPGGQIFRNITRNRNTLPHLGPDYAKGLEQAEALQHPNLTCRFGSTVWRIDDGRAKDGPRVAYSQNGKSQSVAARHVLIATGAQERPTPFPGWTLPGVMPAGAAQILMKSSDLIPREAILAGTGPLLYLIAAQMIDAGTPPLALVETQTSSMMARALSKMPRAMIDRQQVFKGLSLLRKIQKAGVRRYTAAQEFRARPQGDGLTFTFTSKGKEHVLHCALLLCHQGIVPSTNLTRSAGIPHQWNVTQLCWQPTHDDDGRTDRPGLWVAGDGAGIFGADAACAQGVITANAILCALDDLSPDIARHINAHALNRRFRADALRPFLDAAYAPAPEFLSPVDETILCRCEEITAGQVRVAASNGAEGPRQMKTATRAGMGPCQGRMCDLSVTTTLAAHSGRHPTDLGPHRARSPCKPVTLGELSRLDLGD